MKNASDWGLMSPAMHYDLGVEWQDWIRAIQADALEAAAMECDRWDGGEFNTMADAIRALMPEVKR